MIIIAGVLLMIGIFLYGWNYNFFKNDINSKRIRLICLIFSMPVWLPVDIFAIGFLSFIKGHNPLRRLFVNNKENLTIQETARQYIDGVL